LFYFDIFRAKAKKQKHRPKLTGWADSSKNSQECIWSNGTRVWSDSRIQLPDRCRPGQICPQPCCNRFNICVGWLRKLVTRFGV